MQVWLHLWSNLLGKLLNVFIRTVQPKEKHAKRKKKKQQQTNRPTTWCKVQGHFRSLLRSAATNFASCNLSELRWSSSLSLPLLFLMLLLLATRCKFFVLGPTKNCHMAVMHDAQKTHSKQGQMTTTTNEENHFAFQSANICTSMRAKGVKGKGSGRGGDSCLVAKLNFYF